MCAAIHPMIDVLRTQVRHVPSVQRIGAVTGVAGLVIESEGALPRRLDAGVAAVNGVAAVTPLRFTRLKMVGTRQDGQAPETVDEDITFKRAVHR